MINRLEIIIEPDVICFRDAEGHNRDFVKQFRIQLRTDTEKFGYVSLYKEDELKSMFDCIFDIAKEKIRENLENSEELEVTEDGIDKEVEKVGWCPF